MVINYKIIKISTNNIHVHPYMIIRTTHIYAPIYTIHICTHIYYSHMHPYINYILYIYKLCMFVRSIHSSDELKGTLRGRTTCYDPVGIMDWRGVLFTSLRFWHLWGSTIFGSRRLIKVIPTCHQ